MKIQSY